MKVTQWRIVALAVFPIGRLPGGGPAAVMLRIEAREYLTPPQVLSAIALKSFTRPVSQGSSVSSPSTSLVNDTAFDRTSLDSGKKRTTFAAAKPDSRV
jgi:hypothetical protein